MAEASQNTSEMEEKDFSQIEFGQNSTSVPRIEQHASLITLPIGGD